MWVWVWVKFDRRENKKIDVVRENGKLRWEKKKKKKGIHMGDRKEIIIIITIIKKELFRWEWENLPIQ